MFQEHIEIEKSKQQDLLFRKMASLGREKKKIRALHVSCKDQQLVQDFPHTGARSAICQSNVACDGKIGRPQGRYFHSLSVRLGGMDQAGFQAFGSGEQLKVSRGAPEPPQLERQE